jgi:Ca2+/Na+ antiporter
MPINSIDPHVQTAILLMLSVLGLYAACRIAMGAAIPLKTSSPGRRALCQWLPIAATSLAAIFMKHPGVALAVIIGTSVSYLSLVLGMATYVAPMNSQSPRPKIWGFVLVPIVLVLLAGIGGVLTGWHAAVLLALGVVFVGVWRDDHCAEGSVAAKRPDAGQAAILPMQWTQIGLAVALAGVAGVAAIHATVAAAQQARMSSETLAALSVLCPMLTLPSLRSSVTVAERGDVNGAVSAVVGTVLLNFCLLLPIIVLLSYFVTRNTFNPLVAAQPPQAGNYYSPVNGLAYSGHLWQLETIVLAAIGFALLPISLGKITLTRSASAALVLAYAGYLACVAWSQRG